MNKYVIPFILIALGIFMATDIFPIKNDYVISCLNLCAFLFTVSCINLGSVKSKWRRRLSKIFTVTLQIMAVLSLLLIIIDTSSKYYKQVQDFIEGINSNSLLIIGLSATLISIYATKDYSENQQKNTDKHVEQLKKEITALENKYLDLKDKNIKLMSQQKQLLETNGELTEELKEIKDIFNKKRERGQ